MCNSKAQVFIAFFLISAGGKEAGLSREWPISGAGKCEW